MIQKARNKFIKKEQDWKCPRCQSKSTLPLDPLKDHQHFEDQYRIFRILIRCCNCGQQFVFGYELKNIELHSFNPFKGN